MMNSNNKKEDNAKESIKKLADEANSHINYNKYLLEIGKIFKQQIILVKNLITNYSLNSVQNTSTAYDLAIKYKNELLSLNIKVKEEINKNLNKQENILKNINSDLFIENQRLSQFSIDNFILNNTINKYDSKIKSLTSGIESSRKYDLFREPKRENEIELKESKNVFLIHNLESQQKMLSFCRSYTINKYKNVKKQKKINNLKITISSLNNIINFYSVKLYGESNINPDNNKKEQKEKNKENKVNKKKSIIAIPNYKKEFDENHKNKNDFKSKKFISINEIIKENDSCSNESKNKNNSEHNSFNKNSLLVDNDSSLFSKKENEDKNINFSNKNNSERKKINILKIDELLDIENIEVKNEDIIDEELNSDEEVFFEKKVKPKKKISIDFLSNIKKEIPSINLTQIEFNKLKVINEADAYSLQKRKFEQENINGKINKLKKQKKSLQKKIEINKNKLDVIHNFIEDVKYNYKLLRPIKVQTSAAENPVIYIREQFLNIVEETITATEKKDKDKILTDKYKTGKTAVEEGEENDEEVGSDYSDEDEYIDNINNLENKENCNINKDKNNHFEKKKIFKNKEKNSKKIRTNLITKFESHEKEEIKNENNLNHNEIKYDIKNSILGSTLAQSK